MATQVVAATAESASQAAPPVTAVAPKTAEVDAVAPSPVLPAVVHSAYAVTAYTMPTGVVPPALSAAPLSAAPTTMPSAPVSLAPLALVLAAAYPQSSASSVTATAPAATVTTSAPPSAGTPTVVATIPVDPWAIAITKDGKTIYGTSSPYATDANGTPVATVQVVDASTNTQVGEPIPVGQFVAPGNIVTNPTMNRAYVVAYNPATITNPSTGYSQTGYLPSLVVIDTSTNKTIGSPIPLVTSDQTSTTMTSPGPSALAVSPDGSRVYVAGATVTSSYTGQVTSWRPTVTVFDTTTNTQVGDTLGIGPVSTNLYSGTGATSVLVSPDGKRLYVTTASNLTSSSSSSPSVTTTIYTVDSKSGAPVGNPIVLTNDAGALIPQTEALSPDGTKLYVESLSYPAITIGAQNTQPQSAQEIANATVLTFNTSTGQQVGTPINVVGYGVMTLSPDGKTLYVSDVADSRTGKKGSYQPYAGAPNQTMYDGSVTGYNLSTGKGIGAPTTVGLGPTSMVVNPAGTRLYVANMADNTISVIKVTSSTSGTPNLAQTFVIGVQAWTANVQHLITNVSTTIVHNAQVIGTNITRGIETIGQTVSINVGDLLSSGVLTLGDAVSFAFDVGPKAIGNELIHFVQVASSIKLPAAWAPALGKAFGVAGGVYNIVSGGTALFQGQPVSGGLDVLAGGLTVAGFAVGGPLNPVGDALLVGGLVASGVSLAVKLNPGIDQAVDHALKDTVQNVQKVANDTVQNVQKAANDTVHNLQQAANDTGKSVSHGLDNIAHGKWPWQ
ncbi:YncE family protein [Mycolicibacterium mucogenicum]|uniref:YncE family protein n=1 Tax=Mycolicibacterium mucogenicum TaxID=56689 RepID=UPI00226A6723|nr:YncE family protein [Mycolicibacterium mucogenicum]MCX8559479.1 YncE family protein [Mycolicibacterium mucogenicum]